ncbi:uncharacterized protein VP01_757g3 [Puccinia sorghi]|uniref:Uncharacterized protein n=1 Tax=Puccinia sorghi TaxID=27349 RepID=A0A0L6UC10_9BASI|nr:uncharacterized protein VP01_757g3 [Puccinia sorghi]
MAVQWHYPLMSNYPLESDTNNIAAYLYFFKVLHSRKEKVPDILDINDITTFTFFKSKSITHNHMSKWGLSDGMTAQLRENVPKYVQQINKS